MEEVDDLNKLLIIILFSALLIITGCSQATEKQNESSININSSDNGSNVIENFISSKYSDVSGFSIEYSLELGKGLITVFRFNQNTDEYEGIARLNDENDNYNIDMEDHAKVDKSAPFTVHQMSGNYYDSERNKKTYIVISGTVNEEKITEMNLYFNDGQLVSLIVGENRIYSFVRNDKNISIKKIVALDENGNEIFVYPPYPPEKP